MFCRKSLRIFFDYWVQGAVKIHNLEDGIFKTAKTVYRKRLRANFIKFRDQCAKEKRGEFVKNRMLWFAQNRRSATKKDVWMSWLMFIKQYKLAKKFLNRANNCIGRNLESDAFSIWRGLVAKHNEDLYESNIEELHKRQDDHKMSISKMKSAILSDQNTKQHTIA